MRYSLPTLLLLMLLSCQSGQERVSFNDDVRPIFNAKCIGCHGGVKQAGGFGLVFRENALRETHGGGFAIVPGDAAASELIKRARHPNVELRMPLDAPPLSEAEISTLERWIDEGAEWQDHWAYLPANPPAAPTEYDGWATNDIDRYVATGLAEKGLTPTRVASDSILLRRVSFDLTGLPAGPDLSVAFLSGAIDYTTLVDSLLTRPAYGEHWAAKWLDLARYADTRGLEKDRRREIWSYRDWVIRSYNANMPYDQFATEQLAGDLLPNPTVDQLTATAFHRNTMSNDEGGTDNEEFRVVAVMDRVNTTWEVFQGTTMACVQCHAHPYDPIEHADYYRSFALWNNTADRDHGTEQPLLRTFTGEDEQKYRSLTEWINAHAADQAEQRQREWFASLKLRQPRVWPEAFTDVANGKLGDRAEEEEIELRNGSGFALPARNLTGVRGLPLTIRFRDPAAKLEVRLDGPDGQLVGELNGIYEWGEWWHGERRVVLDAITGEHALYLSAHGTDGQPLIGVAAAGLEPPLPGNENPHVKQIERYVQELATARELTTTPVMVEQPANDRRDNYLFERGNWLVRGADVTPGVPKLLGGETAHIDNRLDFAKWLFEPGQPLTARTAVNRVWAAVFGNGLVTSVEDLGSQGAKNRYPAVLDHLALKFSGDFAWSQKALLRYIVTSSTYRQSSVGTPELLRDDPYNDLLARGPRRRLTAEEVHDQILAKAGLLSDKRYGPGVMPPQPEGLWDNIPYSGDKWVTAEGEDRYRRAVYTYLRRSVAHPMLTTFDGSNRELCLSRRVNTNTPLQALMTMNDPLYLEAAAELVRWTDAQIPGNTSAEQRINTLAERILARPLVQGELVVLTELYASACASLEVPTIDRDREALVVVANALLNLDEFLVLT